MFKQVSLNKDIQITMNASSGVPLEGHFLEREQLKERVIPIIFKIYTIFKIGG